ncbi:MAG: CoA transferase, partial [Halobacteriovoraceae bacterium]|nr:CoA transferase [Halobacteriovoraceae bacterium]
MSKLLEDITIVDFTHRLPGPLATKLLSDLGARVVKIEDHVFKDPFCDGLFSQMDESFPFIYRELNHCKEVMRFDFKGNEDRKKINEILDEADAVFMGLPMKVRQRLGLTDEDLTAQKRPLAVIELLASKSHKQLMHDLNALAEADLLSLHVSGRSEAMVCPPFMPMAGIALGNKAATDVLAAVIKSKKQNKVIFTKTYLLEATKDIFSCFWPKEMRRKKQTSFLQNGRYPCYNLYRCRDEYYVALAAVEEKLWNRFCHVFALEIPAEKRFHYRDRSVFSRLIELFSGMTGDEIKQKTANEDFCLSL